MAASEAAKVVSDNIRTEMDLRDLSQSELSRISGMSQPQISELLSGKNDPRLGTIARLAEALDVPLISLLAERPKKVSASA